MKAFHGLPLSLAAILLAIAAAGPAAATGPTAVKSQTQMSKFSRLGDLSTFRSITADTLSIAKKGKLTAAKTRIADLEKAWDTSEPKLKPQDTKNWRTIDKAIDAALDALRSPNPTKQDSVSKLQKLIATMDKVDKQA